MLYPVVTLKPPYDTTRSRRELATQPDAVEAYSVEGHVRSDMPPVFLAHAADDRIADVQHSLLMFQAARAQNVPAELHVFDRGGHSWGLGKPGTHERAVAQLRRMRGQTVVFQTALAVVCEATGFEQSDIAAVRVVFRDLDDDEIEHYLRAEQPYDCAGSAKSEGLGIALLERIDNDDPTALVGLPLIRTCHMIRAAGVKVL